MYFALLQLDQEKLIIYQLSPIAMEHTQTKSFKKESFKVTIIVQPLKALLEESVSKIYILGLFVYLGFYVAFNTVQVISRRVVGRAEETSTYSSLGFCTVNCRPTASNYQLSHLRP